MGIAQTILDQSKGQLDSLATLYKTACSKAAKDGGQHVDDACKIAMTMANIRRDAYMAEISGAAQKGLMSLFGKGKPTGLGPEVPPELLGRLGDLGKRVSGTQAGMVVGADEPGDQDGGPPKK